MSKSSVLRIATAGACMSLVWLVGKRPHALANHQTAVGFAQLQLDLGDTSDCPCFNLENLDATQWSRAVGDTPNCKNGSPLWSIASIPTGIVNAASVHLGLDTCVFVVKFGPNAGMFKADMRLTDAQLTHCVEIIEAKQAELLCVPPGGSEEYNRRVW